MEDCSKEFMNDRLRAMLLQEQKFYQCADYLHRASSSSFSSSAEHPAVCPLQILNEIAALVTDTKLLQLEDDSSRSENNSFATPTSVVQDMSAVAVSQQPQRKAAHQKRHRVELSLLGVWRNQMLDWMCNVVRSKCLNKSLVEISFSILDRFVAIKLNDEYFPSRQEFQLYCLTALHIAFKTSASVGHLSVEYLVIISGGMFPAQRFVAMELEMLKTLKWHVNPPTIMSYCHSYLEISQMKVPKSVFATCEYMAEVAIADEFFIAKSASGIALGIVLLATGQEKLPFASTLKFLLEQLRGLAFVEYEEFDSIIQQLECLWWC